MKYACWLHNIPGFGPKTADQMIANGYKAKDLYEMDPIDLKSLSFLSAKLVNRITESKTTMDQDRLWERLEKEKIYFYTKEQGDYPNHLRCIDDSPYGIFVRGRLPDLHSYSAAVIGARDCTNYGLMSARKIGEDLAAAGIQVISGLARGIDSEAQYGAVRNSGATFAVLGCGINICYPSENRKLYDRIIHQDGGIISEYPPDVPPLAQQFPRRNRIISALSDSVIVVEAREKSGSLITANLALEQGKDVYAMPGPVDSKLSKGCHLLIHEGAGIFFSIEEYLKDMSFESVNPQTQEQRSSLEMSEKILYSKITLLPKGIEELCEETGRSMGEVLISLMNLTLLGLIKEVGKDRYVRIK